jgi:hypothetical protein
MLTLSARGRAPCPPTLPPALFVCAPDEGPDAAGPTVLAYTDESGVPIVTSPAPGSSSVAAAEGAGPVVASCIAIVGGYLLSASPGGCVSAFPLLSGSDPAPPSSSILPPTASVETGVARPRALALDSSASHHHHRAACLAAARRGVHHRLEQPTDVLWVVGEYEAASIPLHLLLAPDVATPPAAEGRPQQHTIGRWSLPRFPSTTAAVVSRAPFPPQPLFEDAAEAFETAEGGGGEGGSEELRPSLPPAPPPALHPIGNSPLAARYVVPGAAGTGGFGERGKGGRGGGGAGGGVGGIGEALASLAPPVLSNAIGAVVRIVSSSSAVGRLAKWWGGGSTQEDAGTPVGPAPAPAAGLVPLPPPPPPPPILAPPRFLERDSELSDGSPDRSVTHAVIDPTGSLMALATTGGRVLLVQTSDMTVLRLWKGFRHATLGFLPAAVDGDGEGAESPRVHLVIYSSARGALELWPLRFGPRVASIKVPKHGRLAYQPAHGKSFATRCFLCCPQADGEVEGHGEGDSRMEVWEVLAESG